MVNTDLLIIGGTTMVAAVARAGNSSPGTRTQHGKQALNGPPAVVAWRRPGGIVRTPRRMGRGAKRRTLPHWRLEPARAGRRTLSWPRTLHCYTIPKQIGIGPGHGSCTLLDWTGP